MAAATSVSRGARRIVCDSYESQMAPAAAFPDSAPMSVTPIVAVRASTEPSTPRVAGVTVAGSGTRTNAYIHTRNSANTAATRPRTSALPPPLPSPPPCAVHTIQHASSGSARTISSSSATVEKPKLACSHRVSRCIASSSTRANSAAHSSSATQYSRDELLSRRTLSGVVTARANFCSALSARRRAVATPGSERPAPSGTAPPESGSSDAWLASPSIHGSEICPAPASSARSTSSTSSEPVPAIAGARPWPPRLLVGARVT